MSFKIVRNRTGAFNPSEDTTRRFKYVLDMMFNYSNILREVNIESVSNMKIDDTSLSFTYNTELTESVFDITKVEDGNSLDCSVTINFKSFFMSTILGDYKFNIELYDNSTKEPNMIDKFVELITSAKPPIINNFSGIIYLYYPLIDENNIRKDKVLMNDKLLNKLFNRQKYSWGSVTLFSILTDLLYKEIDGVESNNIVVLDKSNTELFKNCNELYLDRIIDYANDKRLIITEKKLDRTDISLLSLSKLKGSIILQFNDTMTLEKAIDKLYDEIKEYYEESEGE